MSSQELLLLLRSALQEISPRDFCSFDDGYIDPTLSQPEFAQENPCHEEATLFRATKHASNILDFSDIVAYLMLKPPSAGQTFFPLIELLV
jgi:hypothetical protein